MIRQAISGDYSQILGLWDMCFGEDKVFSSWFFKNRFKISETAVFEKDGKIVSMLQIMPCCIENIGNAGYIYGACTDKNFRNSGFMASLLEYAAQKYPVTILIPQNEELFSFYGKFGYKPCMFAEIKDIAVSFPKTDMNISQNGNIADINDIYEKDTSNFVKRDESFWKLQIKMFSETGGNIYCLNEKEKTICYAFVWNNGFIQEMFPHNAEFAKKISTLLGKNLKYFTAGKKPFACIKGTDKKAYINLMFN